MQFRPIARISKGQAECLNLVYEHLTSKEIAGQLGISPHTVDQRIRIAMRTLEASNRIDAARLFVEGINWRTSNRLGGAYLAKNVLESSRAGYAPKSKRPPLPFPTSDQPRNQMTVLQRLLWIAVIAFSAALSMGMFLAGLESLARLMKK